MKRLTRIGMLATGCIPLMIIAAAIYGYCQGRDDWGWMVGFAALTSPAALFLIALADETGNDQ